MISIILPTYNNEKYIKRTIQSVISQTYSDWELIIINDGSTDNTLKIIEEFKDTRIKIYNNDKNIKQALSRNKALKIATGRYIAYIDSDDIWKKNKLENQLEFMEKNNIAFSYTSYERIREKDGTILRKVDVPDTINYEDLLGNSIILNSTVMIDLAKIDKNKLVMPDIVVAEDIAMWLNILRNNIIAYGLNDGYYVSYTVRKKSISSNKLRNINQLTKIYLFQEKIGFIKTVEKIVLHIKNAVCKRVPNEKFNRLKEILNNLKIQDFLDIFYLIFIYIINLFAKFSIKKEIWIIEENPYEACDNGFALFKYIMKNRKDINCFYVIDKKSKQLKKLEQYKERIVYHRSFKHWIYYLNAKYILVTQKYANPSPAIFYILHCKNKIKGKRIFLQHGIIFSDVKNAYAYSKSKFDLFICGANGEYEYVKNEFGYDEDKVVLTGLARFDYLKNIEESNTNVIVVAPTWRKWIKNKKQGKEYFETYNLFLNDEKLHKILKNQKLKIIFIFHKNMKKYIQEIKTDDENITIVNNCDIDVQSLIKSSKMLITDYSSIAADYAYLNKPIIYYQFDLKKYRENHQGIGYFSYNDDGFGKVCYKKHEVIELIEYYCKRKFKIEDQYLSRINGFFKYRDYNNCKRIMDEIEYLYFR